MNLCTAFATLLVILCCNNNTPTLAEKHDIVAKRPRLSKPRDGEGCSLEKCSKVYTPICGSNDKTYPNQCELDKASCLLKLEGQALTAKKKGPCKPMRTCPTGCQDIYAPVCGSDSKTYSSLCAMKLRRCGTKQDIRPTKVGKCERNHCPEFCPFAVKPTCGNDGNVYQSECEMKLTACRLGKRIKRAKAKRCERNCISYCTSDDIFVCGSDNVTYGNECILKKTACDLKKTIVLKSEGMCSADLKPKPGPHPNAVVATNAKTE